MSLPDGQRRAGASMTNVSQRLIEGFQVFDLCSEEVQVSVMPELGAKVISLLHRKTGREWMWKAPHQPQYNRLPTGSSFAQGPLVGGDECIPTIAPCCWRGLSLPDHGEVWTEAWDLDSLQLKGARIVTRLRFPISPLSIERTMRLDRATVRFDYALQNHSPGPFEYVWAFHPLLTIETGDRIILPDDCRRVRTDACFGDCPLGERGDGWEWPRPTPAIDLSRLDLGGEGRGVKLYTQPLNEGRVELGNEKTRERMIFEFDTNEINTVGIWINQGGFGGFRHVALEPTNGAPDALDVAVDDWKRFGRLSPGETKRWSFSIRLTQS